MSFDALPPARNALPRPLPSMCGTGRLERSDTMYIVICVDSVNCQGTVPGTPTRTPPVPVPVWVWVNSSLMDCLEYLRESLMSLCDPRDPGPGPLKNARKVKRVNKLGLRLCGHLWDRSHTMVNAHAHALNTIPFRNSSITVHAISAHVCTIEFTAVTRCVQVHCAVFIRPVVTRRVSCRTADRARPRSVAVSSGSAYKPEPRALDTMAPDLCLHASCFQVFMLQPQPSSPRCKQAIVLSGSGSTYCAPPGLRRTSRLRRRRSSS